MRPGTLFPGVADQTSGASGPAQITDPGAMSLGQAFYRVRLLPEGADLEAALGLSNSSRFVIGENLFAFRDEHSSNSR